MDKFSDDEMDEHYPDEYVDIESISLTDEDSRGDDSSEDRSTSNGSATFGRVFRAFQGSNSKEEQRVARARFLFLFVLFLAAGALSGIVYWLTYEDEIEDFQAQVSLPNAR